jgi:hypothetical protein
MGATNTITYAIMGNLRDNGFFHQGARDAGALEGRVPEGLKREAGLALSSFFGLLRELFDKLLVDDGLAAVHGTDRLIVRSTAMGSLPGKVSCSASSRSLSSCDFDFSFHIRCSHSAQQSGHQPDEGQGRPQEQMGASHGGSSYAD